MDKIVEYLLSVPKNFYVSLKYFRPIWLKCFASWLSCYNQKTQYHFEARIINGFLSRCSCT